MKLNAITLFFLVLVIYLPIGCKSKKNIPVKERPQRVVVIKEEKKPSVITPVVTKPKPKNPVVALPDVPKESYNDVVATYISTYSSIAKQEMQLYGIPASITLAQGILESGAGKGNLTKKANNHFGIKCHKGWTGARVYHDDDELQECFRKYKDPNKSFRDHSLFLSQRSRYRFLFELSAYDYKGWAKGLRKAGYATDPKYPDKLIRIIERYGLSDYDRQLSGDIKTQNNPVPSRTITYSKYTVAKGDTLYSIAKRHNMTVDAIKSLNGLTSNSISIGQTLSLKSQ